MKTIIFIAAAALLSTPAISSAQNLVAPTAIPGGSSAGRGVVENPTTSRSSRKIAPPVALATAESVVIDRATSTASYYGVRSSRGDSIPPVMVRFSSPDAKTSATLEEDLFVMARVISRTLERAEVDKMTYKMNVPMLLTGSGRSVRPMYIEGSGPLFMIKVNFPVMRPAKTEENVSNPETSESEWTEARHEVFGEPETGVEESPGRNSNFNEEQVELLKKELIGALKNAANIRGLKPDESVNIAVFGHANSVRVAKVTPAATDSPGRSYSVNAVGYVSVSGAGKGSVLTLHAKKSDIDAFASGKLDSEAFKAKVTTTTYAGSGAGTTSINSWIQESVGR